MYAYFLSNTNAKICSVIFINFITHNISDEIFGAFYLLRFSCACCCSKLVKLDIILFCDAYEIIPTYKMNNFLVLRVYKVMFN